MESFNDSGKLSVPSCWCGPVALAVLSAKPLAHHVADTIQNQDPLEKCNSVIQVGLGFGLPFRSSDFAPRLESVHLLGRVFPRAHWSHRVL